MGDGSPWAAGLAVGLAIFFMERLGCLHPPGGATALVAIIGGKKVHA
jgi:CBS-domain-containing membrane protein